MILRATKLDLAHYVGCDKFAICRVSCYKRLTRFKNALQKVEDIEYEIAREFNLLLPVSVKRMAKDVEENALQTSKRSLTYEGSNVKPVAITSEVLPLASDTEEFNLDGSVSKPNASAFDVPGHIFGGGTCSLIAPNIDSNTVHQPAEGCIKIAKSPKSCEIKTSTPINKAKPSSFEQPDVEPVKKQTKVFLTVRYPSKTVRKELTDDFETLGKAIAHGSPQRIAKAALKIVTLKKHILEKVLKLLTLQVSGLCSRRNPSMLRAKTKEDFASFEFQNLCIEWKEKVPLFYAFLMTVATFKNKNDQQWFPSVAIAGSILLKQRNSRMNGCATILGILLKTRSIEVRWHFLYNFVYCYVTPVLDIEFSI